MTERKGQEMKFADFIEEKAICADLQAEDKESVIKELIDALGQAGRVRDDSRKAVIAAVMKREELGSTGIGRKVAVPHTKHGSVDRLVGTVGLSRDGVDFHSLDGDKVEIIFLLVSPPDRPGDHLRALEYISRRLRDDTFCRFLRQAKTVEEIKQLLDEADNNQL